MKATLATLSVLLASSIAHAGTLGLQQAGNDASYFGPGAPAGTFAYDFTFDPGTGRLDITTDSPSGNISAVLEADLMNEVSRGFWFNEDIGLNLASDTINFQNETVTDVNIGEVDRVAINYFDAQFDEGFLTTALQIQPSTAPNVVTIPEPSAAILACLGLVIAMCRPARELLKRRELSGALVLAAVGILATASAHADGGHGTHPEWDTPIGISRWMHSDDLQQAIKEGPTIHVRDDGSLKMYAQQDVRSDILTWFHEDLAWRWKDSDNGPFSTSCVYVPDGDFCSADFYALSGGKPLFNLDGSQRATQKYINYVQERAGYLPPSIAQDTDTLIDNLWFDWQSAHMARTSRGVGIVEVEESLGADRLTLVSNNPPSAIPEPTTFTLAAIGMAASLFVTRKRKDMDVRQQT